MNQDRSAGFVIIGGGPSALAAARAYREAGGEDAVQLLSADVEAPYARPPLSKEFLRAEVDDDVLPLEESSFYRDQRVEVALDDPVTDWDTTAHTVTTAAGVTVTYEQCLLATGAEPKRPSVPGAEHAEVRTLRSARSARQLREIARNCRSAIVAGAGFIGCEAAVSLRRLGVQITMLCPDPAPQHTRLGPDAGGEILRWLKAEGVSVVTGTTLGEIEAGHRVRLDPGPVLDTDLVLLATGVSPRRALAEQAGLTIEQGRVCADERLRASAEDVYAAGDVVLARNATAQRHLPVEHWGEAESMGAIAGANAAGEQRTWHDVPGFWSVIGDRVLKYAAWGDGFDEARMIRHDDDAFTVWYGIQGVTVGVLTHRADEDYEHGTALVEKGAPLP